MKINAIWWLVGTAITFKAMTMQPVVAMDTQLSNIPDEYDLVVISGTPAGIMAAIAAGRLGKTSLILERTGMAGGLVVNGLGATDLITRAATGGIFLEFVKNIERHYQDTYGEGSEQVALSKGGYHFEPSIAKQVLDKMLADAPNVTVLTNRQFDAYPANVSFEGDYLKSVTVTNRVSGEAETYSGKIFIDASYEGDLLAAAGVPYFLGREGKGEYNEPYAGIVYKPWMGDVQEAGSSNLADNAIQAYNYRVCLTNNPRNMVKIPRPQNYNREEFVSIIDDIRLGRHTGIEYLRMTEEEKERIRQQIRQGIAPEERFVPHGMQRLVNMVMMPNGKTDANNQHRALLSTDLPEENWPWPTASWEWRDRFAKRLKDYTLGLLYFGQNDPELPQWFRDECNKWGLAKDEFQENSHFPEQVYVREGRRLDGMYLFKTHDAMPVADGLRPPIHQKSITASHYDIDSHATKKREEGKQVLEGFLSYPTAPYTVPLGVILPKQLPNLIVPVAASATHLGMATLRMEPCWMALGQAGGVVASMAIASGSAVQEVDIVNVQRILVDQGAVLMYYKDVTNDHPHFKALQFLGPHGYIDDWNARLDDKVTDDTLLQWKAQSKLVFPDDINAGVSTRGEVLQYIYDSGDTAISLTTN